MPTSEVAQLIALVAAVLAVAALVLLVMVNNRLKKLQRGQRVILGSRGDVDIVGHVVDLDEKVDHLRMAMEDLTVTAKDHEVRIDSCLARVGMVRFDAYEDLGGRQSTSVAFLDSRENGVVVTTVVSREFARMYVKTLKEGRPDVPLAPEETEAFDQARARGAGPFTARPRLERILEEKGLAPEETAESGQQPDLEEQEAALRALERENRRRARRGLAPLDELPAPPSTLGWQGMAPLATTPPNPTEVAAEESTAEIAVQPQGPPYPDKDQEEDLHWAPDWEDRPVRQGRAPGEKA